MDPREIIRRAAEEYDFDVTVHAQEEADKDGMSIEMMRSIMLSGTVHKRRPPRYTLRLDGRFVAVEMDPDGILVVTTGRCR